MHAAGFGLGPHPAFPQYPPPPGGAADPAAAAAAAAVAQPGMADPAQIQQLVQLLGAKMLPKQTAVVECPKSMVGRVIGKGGETIKSLQQYTGAMIQIDQSTDPTRVTIAGSPQSLQLAVSMVNDIVRGTFKGFAMLRQIALSTTQPGMPGFGQPQPVYVQGYGFVPPSQVYNPDDPLAAAGMLRSSPPSGPSGPLTPPMTPLRGPAAGGLAGGLTPEALAALLGQQQQGMGGMGMGEHGAGSQDTLLGQLLGQLAGQQQQAQAPTMNLQQHQHGAQQMSGMGQQGGAPQHGDASQGLGGADQAAIHALLAQAGLLGPGQHVGGGGAGMAAHAQPPASAGLMLGGGAQVPLSAGSSSPAHSAASVPLAAPSAGSMYRAPSEGPAAASYLGTSPTATHSSADTGSGRASPAVALSSANPSLITRRPASDAGSPLGRYGAVGSPSSQGAASIGAAAEEALAAKMSAAAITTRELGEQGAPITPPRRAKGARRQGQW
ncbi:hypothetical protein CHLNCDRAFT_137888 [Chlorella variabilis]|uniref:K Homology domain-containing protein n=1 Tax=Chlorella variabilis TaxID=554065 RepID=E1Z4R7_CHLVA|nr:hypothetical protein CHLNCDRAFT_137888 [Chlorella variabilis]EFN59102.1 hypothetical protein CHLNCDRAFT_137888 [Chlorella variabilis]|eukprot:XP_005851204.1 hypothetical protein CHLNCDRAFT_137888 [Chlorella variabilis]